jgi:hypothetical protein
MDKKSEGGIVRGVDRGRQRRMDTEQSRRLMFMGSDDVVFSGFIAGVVGRVLCGG